MPTIAANADARKRTEILDAFRNRLQAIRNIVNSAVKYLDTSRVHFSPSIQNDIMTKQQLAEVHIVSFQHAYTTYLQVCNLLITQTTISLLFYHCVRNTSMLILVVL